MTQILVRNRSYLQKFSYKIRAFSDNLNLLKTIKGLKPSWFQALILFSYFLRVFLAMAMRVNTWYPTTAMRVALIIPLNAN